MSRLSDPLLITFDCYGTLIDWYGGLRGTLERLLPGSELDRLCDRYVELEMEVEAGPYRPYREVMASTLARLLEEAGTPLPAGEEDALGRALPGWEPFPEVPAVSPMSCGGCPGRRVSRLAADFPAICEMDLNPILVYPAGTPPAAVDVRLKVE